MFEDFSEESGYDTGVTEPRTAEMWAAVANNTKLGQGHAILAHFVGRWKYSLDCDFAGYGPVMEAHGESDHRLLYGGRYLLMRTTAEGNTKNIDCLSVMAYNRLSDQFSCSIFEQDAVAPLQMRARWDEGLMSICGDGQMASPILGTMHRVWLAWRLVSPERIHFTMEVPGQRGERLQSCMATFELLDR